ncbi:uncharacterized protein [Zea mays]|uniref:uncharacterized protein isoform X2 n=1 Tax=Zea mays TaxID=4577 RepID=UPI0009A996F6|nr:uncharacterized protein LOC100275689 isoform X2 [Zea mays]|eukprot:XP_020394067.1 uncharacterized protein LOC100275689 isoform X2 [Zea mays]
MVAAAPGILPWPHLPLPSSSHPSDASDAAAAATDANTSAYDIQIFEPTSIEERRRLLIQRRRLRLAASHASRLTVASRVSSKLISATASCSSGVASDLPPPLLMARRCLPPLPQPRPCRPWRIPNPTTSSVGPRRRGCAMNFRQHIPIKWLFARLTSCRHQIYRVLAINI